MTIIKFLNAQAEKKTGKESKIDTRRGTRGSSTTRRIGGAGTGARATFSSKQLKFSFVKPIRIYDLPNTFFSSLILLDFYKSSFPFKCVT